MSTSNVSGNRPAEAGLVERAKELSRQLGGRMPGEILGELIPALTRLTVDLPENLLHVPERRGRWSIVEVIQHLADNELVYGFRVRQMLAEEMPTIVSFDQAAWAEELRYNDRKLDTAMAQLRALRAANLLVFRSLDRDQWNRRGADREGNVESVYVIALSLAVHDELHLRQIRRIRDSLK